MGYGSFMNVKRIVQLFVQVGVVGVMIEDQIWFKSMFIVYVIVVDFERM